MPNQAAIQAAMDAINERELVPFMEKGNLMARNLYADLELPWSLDPKVEAFDEGTFFRKLYGPNEGNSGEFSARSGMELNLDALEKVLGTASPVQRWRDANKEKVGTEADVIRVVRREIERCLHEAGVEKGKEVVKGNLTGVLLIIKKKAEVLR